jgi:hypothetical protein
MTIGKEGLDQKGMKVRKIFDEGCSLEWTGDLEAWFLEYLNSDVDAGVKMMIGIWTAQRSRLAFLSY